MRSVNLSLAIEILNGPKKGKTYLLKNGISIGRNQSDISLNDQKISSQHAYLKKINTAFYLVDNSSANGIVVNGEKLKHIQLVPGLIFQLGKTLIKVVEETSPNQVKTSEPSKRSRSTHENLSNPTKGVNQKHSNKTPSTNEVESPKIKPPSRKKTAAPTSPSDKVRAGTKKKNELSPSQVSGRDKAPKNVADPKAREHSSHNPVKKSISSSKSSSQNAPLSWRSALASFINSTLKKVKNQASKIEPLSQPIILEFYRGIQYNTAWTLGYGPRIVGPRSFEFPIFEPAAPDTCFEIHPHINGVQFLTNYPAKIQVNGHPETSVILKEGDVISILNQTYIEVKWAYEAD